MRLYTVYDRVAECAGPIMMAANDGVALRMFRGVLQQVAPVDSDSYWLYYIGDYTEDDMVIVPVKPSRIVFPDMQLKFKEVAE